MKVEDVKDGTVPQPNHVYVMPANCTLIISDGRLRLRPRNGVDAHMPIDVFFRSLAASEGSKAIGVILSGTASDGTLGLKAIKAEGGITFCQDQESAKYDGMPRSAVAAGCVDFVMTPREIAHELVRLCRHPYVTQAAADNADNAKETRIEPDFREIFTILRSATGVDFAYYKDATIRRRILRRMALNQIETPEEYVNFMRQNRGELQSLFQDILINVTQFFREPELFDFLKARVFPAICANRKNDDPIRVWVPGCSTGEEAYSVGICLLEYLRDNSIETSIQIFGTDLSESALEKARAGVYAASIANEVSPERLRKFFVKVDGSYQIARPVRDLCVFARQNLTKDPPFSKLDLISCCNVLIYLGPVLQQKLMRVFHYALKPTGYLALGISETAGSNELFQVVDRKHKVYVRRNTLSTVALDLDRYEDSPVAPAPSKSHEWSAVDAHRKIDLLLLNRYSPPGVVVDAELKIVEFRGRTAPYLEHAAGEANLNLLKMSRGGLGMEIRKLVQKAKLKDATISHVTPVGQGNTVRTVRISVIPVHGIANEEAQYIVLFEETHPEGKEREPKQPKQAVRAPVSHRIQELEQELSSTKVYLQSVIEEQEATTEALKSANEEIRSSNEELQSTNEELLTAKEELQSTNEELTTVNEEMHGRNAELTQINNDLSNLLSSVNIPIVMLGNDLRIRRFTPQAEKVLNLFPADIGRPISDFRPKINVPDLEQVFLDVIDDLSVRERHVEDEDGRSYSLWVRPYRTSDNKIDGAVMALFDVTEPKSLAEARYRRLFEAARDGILIIDSVTGEILDANPSIISLLGYQQARLTGRRMAETGIFSTEDLEEMAAKITDNQAWQRILSLTSHAGEHLDVEVVANSYLEGDRRVLQLSIRDLSGRRHVDLLPRDAQNFQIANRIASPIAHRMNNLVTAIVGYTGAIREQLGDGHPVESDLNAIVAAGEKASALARQFLAFGHEGSSAGKILNLNEIVADLEQVLRVMLPEGVQLELSVAGEPVCFKAERFQIEQVIIDLVANARHGMRSGGKLSVATSRRVVDEEFSKQHPAVPPGEYAVLSLADTGSRMEESPSSRRTDRPLRAGGARVFDALQSAIRAADGHLWSYSETGKGTHVAVYFPLVARDHALDLPVAPGGAETILLVDPDAPVLELAARALRERGYTVLTAANGMDALQVFGEHPGPIQLLISEMTMPSMNGPELADRIAIALPGIPVVYLSGDSDATIAELVIAEERNGIVRKPFTADALAHRVRAALDEAK
jgi:two-component system CheB/CheR fusion protein